MTLAVGVARSDAGEFTEFDLWETDKYAATRRAIVRAAAEIGKGIQLQTVEGVLEDNYYKSQAEAEELGRQTKKDNIS